MSKVDHGHCQEEGEEESFRLFTVALFVNTSNDPLPTMLLLASITDSRKTVLDPYSTSHGMTTYIDSIQDSGNGTVTFRNGDDVMVMTFQDDATCTDYEQRVIEENFPGSSDDPKSMFLVSSYPNRFDWGCDSVAANFSFCRKLKERECELSRFGNDVCGVYSTTDVKRCPSSMQFEKLTGSFRDVIPLSTEFGPITSIESESIHVNHDVGIMFPCFS
ncbi:uncharacterized protein [Apostichopus japonicus]|uniref:uncharacterized protein n=1 Tax=Stichopus japonicus TaxID=307972 RepID=UPI003AB544F0